MRVGAAGCSGLGFTLQRGKYMNTFRTVILTGALIVLAHTAANAQEKIIFSLQWIANGNNFGVFAAKEQGLYRAANLDVDVQRGYGSGDTAKRVSTGTADIGIADSATVIVGRSNGLKVRQVASLYERSPDAIFFLKGNGISKPKDLEGRTIGATAGEATVNFLPIFAANAGFDNKKMEIVNMSPSAKYASLVAKTVDSIVGFVNEEPAIRNAATKTGLEVGRFVFSDYGINYYSLGIIASDESIAKRPDMVRKIALATMQGYASAIKNPQAAADAFVKNYPESSREIALQQWDVALPLILTERSRKNGLGWIEGEKMADTIKLIAQFQKVDPSIGLGDVYARELLPRVAVE
jgi:NitT/TauT family transport system substrate-binding protein